MRAKAIHRSPVQAVDITGNERRLGARLGTMQKVAELFTRGARRSLPFLVRRRARLVAGQVGPAAIALEEAPPGPSCQVVLEAPGKTGWAALRLDVGALQLIVDGSLGGAAPEEGAEQEPPPAQLTLAQRALVARVGRALGADLAEALRVETAAALDLVRAECHRAGEEPALPKDAVAAECIFEGVGGRATLWLLASGDILESSSQERATGESQAGDPRLVAALAEVPLEVVVELGRVRLGLRRVLALRPGEVLRLGTATDDPVQVRVGGLPKLQGVPVLSRGQLSVQITGRHAE